MNRDEFNRCVSELHDVYGEKSFGKEVMARLWRIFEPLYFTDVQVIIENVIEESPRTPTLGVIKRACLPFIRKAQQAKNSEQIHQLEETNACEYCGSTGFINALLRESPQHEFSFRCNRCTAAVVRRLSQSIPLWSNELKEKYVPYSLREESFVTAMKVRNGAMRSNAKKATANVMTDALDALSKLGYGDLVSAIKREDDNDA